MVKRLEHIKSLGNEMLGTESNSRIGISRPVQTRKRAGIDLVVRVTAAYLLACGAAPAVRANPVDFYRGKAIEILVGFSAGGGYDAYARALARSMADHVPGNPRL